MAEANIVDLQRVRRNRQGPELVYAIEIGRFADGTIDTGISAPFPLDQEGLREVRRDIAIAYLMVSNEIFEQHGDRTDRAMCCSMFFADGRISHYWDAAAIDGASGEVIQQNYALAGAEIAREVETIAAAKTES